MNAQIRHKLYRGKQGFLVTLRAGHGEFNPRIFCHTYKGAEVLRDAVVLEYGARAAREEGIAREAQGVISAVLRSGF